MSTGTLQATQFTTVPVTYTPSTGYGARAVVTAPDGTAQTISASSASALPDVWTVWILVDQVGTYSLNWIVDGVDVVGSTALVVSAPSEATPLLTLDDCYQSLNMGVAPSESATYSDRDRDMLAYATAAAAVVEGIVGPVMPRTVTEVWNGGEMTIRLRYKPTGITSIVENGQQIYDWTPDLAAGVIYAGTTWWNRPYWPGQTNVEITYTAGDGNPAPNVVLAAREEFRFLWQLGRQSGQAAAFNEQIVAGDAVPQGFAIPNRVYELLQFEDRMPGFA